jgi:hypothetical protein
MGAFVMSHLLSFSVQLSKQIANHALRETNGMLQFCMKLLSWFLLALIPVCLHAQSASSGTVPFVLDGNRVYARVEFILPDGRPRNALVFVDLGSPAVTLSKKLYADLDPGSRKTLELRIGEMDLILESANVASDDTLPFSIGEDRKVEGVLPAGVLQNYQVRFDYAGQTMTLAQPATPQMRGTKVPFRLNPKTGLIAIEAQIDGHTFPITVDNGSGYTWIRQAVAQKWFTRHPNWQRGFGAVGPSNMRMADDGIEPTAALIRIPAMKLGSLSVRQVGALAIAPDDQGHDFGLVLHKECDFGDRLARRQCAAALSNHARLSEQNVLLGASKCA